MPSFFHAATATGACARLIATQYSKECFVSGGVPHPRNLIYIEITTFAALLSAID
jgi:hypothetical protein